MTGKLDDVGVFGRLGLWNLCDRFGRWLGDAPGLNGGQAKNGGKSG